MLDFEHFREKAGRELMSEELESLCAELVGVRRGAAEGFTFPGFSLFFLYPYANGDATGRKRVAEVTVDGGQDVYCAASS